MGQTLENGVYLPSEGERNCYAGLKTNWEILDQKVADVTALQQAVAGALHREIVESLPTTDIDPNTIYMVLSGTSATENVYNEFMYVNNAWELIGTSATDLTNYYTKGEVDGLLLLKANASDLTSHTGDTTIHVTTTDKNKWNNNVTQAYVFRYSSTALVASSTNSNALLDNTDNLKVGDKVIDSSGVLFSITAIDTANSTFTVGSALVDLALDGNVVHTSGNETVGGRKTFSDDLLIYNADNSVDTPRLNIKTSKYVKGDTTNTDTMRINFFDSNGNSVASVYANKNISGSQYLTFQVYTTDNNNANITSSINYYISKSGDKYFIPYEDSQIGLGGTVRRWKSVYATNYYYGSNNVEFSTKFVTTDTAQTISGVKSFSDNISTKKIISNVAQLQINARSSADSVAIIAGANASEGSGIWLYGKDNATGSDCRIQIYNTTKSRYERIDLVGSQFLPTPSGELDCGSASNKWKTFNGLTPSSLSLPDFSNRVDISSYISNLSGSTNNYTPTVNGWLYIGSNDASYLALFDTGSGGCGIRFSDGVVGEKYAYIPCQANRTLGVRITCTNLAHAYFVPCLGNV